MKSILMVTGDVSGDLQGSLLAQALKELSPQIKLFGLGGPKMEKEGVEIKFNVLDRSSIGLLENVKNILPMMGIMQRLKRIIEKERPACAVLIDYQGFNLQLAKYLKAKGIPRIYYVPPQYWAWKKKAAKNVAKLVDKIIAILPPEQALYQEVGGDVSYVGHPLVDVVQARYNRIEAAHLFKLNATMPIIGLLPGSRKQEIKRHLPLMLKAAKMLHQKFPSLQFILPLAAPFLKEEVLRVIADENCPFSVEIVENNAYEIINLADLVIISCGLTALETTILETPMIVVYKLSKITYLLVRRMLNTSLYSAANILAQKEIVPELIQDMATPENIFRQADLLLSDPRKMEEMRANLKRAKESLGKGGAAKKAAQLILEIIEKQESQGDAP